MTKRTDDKAEAEAFAAWDKSMVKAWAVYIKAQAEAKAAWDKAVNTVSV